MKKLSICALTIFVCFMFTVMGWSAYAAVPVFTKYEGNPLISSYPIHSYSLYKLDDQYRLFFLECNSSGTYPTDFNIDLMTSEDGLTWGPVYRNVLSSAQTGRTFNYYVTEIKQGDTYKAWHTGAITSMVVATRLYYSTSQDGINYTGHGVVLDIGSYPEYDSRDILWPQVVFDGNKYHLYYVAYQGDPYGPIDDDHGCTIAYATSTDGINWTKHGVVLYPGQEGSFDSVRLVKSCVIYDNNKFEMFYTGLDETRKMSIGYATSDDGLHWQKAGKIDSLDEPMSEYGVCAVGVIKENGIYKLWYNRGPQRYLSELCYATSDGFDGLVAYYPFNGNANDESGNGNHGIEQNGVTYVDGVLGQAAQLDGINDYISVDKNAIDGLDSLSLGFWAKTVDNGTGDTVFSSANSQNHNEFLVCFDVGRIRNQIKYTETRMSASYNDNQWHHFVITRQSSVVKYYVDGILAHEWTTAATGALIVDENGFVFGADQDCVGGCFTDPTEYYKGLLDEVRIYNHALSEAEILALYNLEIPTNQIPVANPGSNQTIHAGATVTLDGSGSTDPDGNYPLTYAWEILSKPAGSAATLSYPSIVNSTFIADLPGDYSIQLIVTDSLGTSSTPATVTVSTLNTPPVADAGEDQAITTTGSVVQLDGSGSWDDDGDPITYAWSIKSTPDSSLIALSDPVSAIPTFVPDVYGDYIFELVVMDSWVSSTPDAVKISFNNIKPIADAGGNHSTVVGDTVSMNGSGSYDANNDPITYTWSIVSKPQGSMAELTDTEAVQTTLTPDLPGSYVVSLIVNDGYIDSNPNNITVTAISITDATTDLLQECIVTINTIDPIFFKNKNMINTLTNKINAVLEKIDQGLYEDAFNQLKNDVLKKTNGCTETGETDKNDWIQDCVSQDQVYPLILEAIGRLENLIQ